MNYTLHHGDCLEILRTLPSGSVDCVVTDPPYSEKTHAGARASIDKKLIGFSHISQEDLRAVLVECGRVCRRWVVATVDWRHIKDLEDSPPAGLRFVRFGVWLKTNGAPQFTGDRPATGWEAIVYLHKDGEKLAWNGGGHHGSFVLPKVNGKHPTTKPLPMVEKWINWFTAEGDTILDPFMGSGTTGVACVQTGRKFIGCEIDEKYVEIARRRIAEAVPLEVVT
jgi:site-specific DNA-methyltransferase (adenine-specific)